MPDIKNDGGIYLSRINPDDARVIDQLTQSRRWDYAQFRQVLIALGVVGNGYSIPASNRPDSIHLQGWRQDLDDIVQRTGSIHKEHGKTVFVDTQKKSLIMGLLIIGDERQILLDPMPQPGREGVQKAIALLHTHTGVGDNLFMANGFSDADYVALISNPELQALLVGFGDRNLMMALKTSVTPNNLSQESIERRVRSTREDFIDESKNHPLVAVAEFNKAVCSEFGLVLYKADAQQRDLLTRVEVTK